MIERQHLPYFRMPIKPFIDFGITTNLLRQGIAREKLYKITGNQSIQCVADSKAFKPQHRVRPYK